jgi:hydroxymethylglutaryl-CoA lyase
MASTPPQSVEIVEVGPRDGLQNESVLVSTAAKIAYIDALVAAGARRIEATSFVRPDRVPQLADAEAVMAGVPRRDGVSYIGLVMNARGLDRALAAGVDEVNVVVLATETFSRRNQGMSVADSVATFATVSARARERGLRATATIGASFGCPFEGEVAVATVTELARQCAESGADEIAMADTIGVGVPADVGRLVEEVRAVTALPLRLHFHNTRNTGYANAIAGLEHGATIFDASVGGLGGCPFAPRATGNIATEDLVYLLDGLGVETGVDLNALIGVSEWLAGVLGRELPGQLYKAGPFVPTG